MISKILIGIVQPGIVGSKIRDLVSQSFIKQVFRVRTIQFLMMGGYQLRSRTFSKTT